MCVDFLGFSVLYPQSLVSLGNSGTSLPQILGVTVCKIMSSTNRGVFFFFLNFFFNLDVFYFFFLPDHPGRISSMVVVV